MTSAMRMSLALFRIDVMMIISGTAGMTRKTLDSAESVSSVLPPR
jgi:hypothetical protein